MKFGHEAFAPSAQDNAEDFPRHYCNIRKHYNSGMLGKMQANTHSTTNPEPKGDGGAARVVAVPVRDSTEVGDAVVPAAAADNARI